MSREQARLRLALWSLSQEARAPIVKAAERAAARDPRIDPSYADCLMASAGAAAHYRHVQCVDGDVVYYTHSSSPADHKGRAGRCSLEKWRSWARRAMLQHWASIEVFVPGAGWQLYDDVLLASH